MKLKQLQKIFSGFCAAVMAMSCLVTSVGAEGDTKEAEIEYGLKYLDSLPKRDEENFDKFLQLPDIDKMNENRESTVKHKDGSEEKIPVPEKTVYQQIFNEVSRIEDKVDGKITSKDDTPKGDDPINNDNMSRDMKIAGEIYKWVATNIEYDYESIEKDENGQEPFRKPQDALFVYKQKMGVCAGKAELTALMMKMAKIPSAYIGTLTHAYNAIYLEDNNADRRGWTLLDSTNGSLSTYDKKYIKENIIDINGEGLFFYKFDHVKNADIFDYENLSEDFLSRLRNRNEETKPDRYNAYEGEVKKIFNNLLKKYSEELSEKNKESLEGNIGKINGEINSKLNELNNQFKDVVVIKNFNIYLDCGEYDNGEDRDRRHNLCEKAETSLNFYEAAQILEERVKKGFDTVDPNGSLLEDRITFFPSFYNAKLGFKSANQNIVKYDDCYIIKNISNFGDFETRYEHRLKIDGIEYKLSGERGRAYLSLFGDHKKPVTKVQIPSDIANLGMTFKLNDGIESIYLKGDMTVDLSGAVDLKEIDTRESNKYNYKYRALFGKNKNEVIQVVNSLRATEEGMRYIIELNDDKTKIERIGFYGPVFEQRADVRIPEYLTQLNVPIKIGSGIESLILEGDEILDLSEASDLKNINADQSKKYTFKLGVLFDKETEKVIKVVNKCGKTEDGIEYQIDWNENETNIEQIEFYSFNDKHADVKIPEYLTQLNVPIKIGLGIESLILEGDEILDLSKAFYLENINADQSKKYIYKGGVLLDRETKAVIKVLHEYGKTEDGIEYRIELNENETNIERIAFYSFDDKHADVKIPKDLTQLNVPIQICLGIESLILEGDEILDLSVASGLESVNIKNSTRYEERNGKIFDKKLNTELKFPEYNKITIIK